MHPDRANIQLERSVDVQHGARERAVGGVAAYDPAGRSRSGWGGQKSTGLATPTAMVSFAGCFSGRRTFEFVFDYRLFQSAHSTGTSARRFAQTVALIFRRLYLAERYGKSNNLLDLKLSALYELAAPNTSDEVREVVDQRLAAGETVTLVGGSSACLAFSGNRTVRAAGLRLPPVVNEVQHAAG